MTSRKNRGRPRKAIDEALLSAAAEEFLAHGYDAASLDSIAGAAATTKPALYRRYVNKQALFEAALYHLAEGFDLDFSALIEDRRPPEAVLLDLAQAFFAHQSSPRVLAMARLAIGDGSRFPALMPMVRQAIMRGYLTHLVAYLARLDSERVVRIPDPEAAAVIFTTLTGGVFERLLGVEPEPAAVQPYLAELVRFFLSGYGYGEQR